jgi:hypothetical protein
MATPSAALKRRRVPTPTQEVENRWFLDENVPLKLCSSESSASSEPSAKRVRISTPPVGKIPFRKTFRGARVEFWIEKGRWPTEEQEKTMDRFEGFANMLAQERHQRHLSLEVFIYTAKPFQAPTLNKRSEQKSAVYKLPRYEDQPQERRRFIDPNLDARIQKWLLHAPPIS